MSELIQGGMPKWLYGLLPFFYAASGLATMIVLRNGLAIFSGLLLIAAGGLVWFMRLSSRKAAAARSLPGRSRPGLIDIVWRPGFNSGNRLIDQQHRSLFAVANRLADEITNHQPEATVKQTLRELIQDIQDHFRAEEELLDRAAPALAAAHKAEHARLLKEVGGMVGRVTHGIASGRELIGFVIVDVIANHLTEEDAKFFPLLKN